MNTIYATSDGPRGGTAPASAEPKLEGRGVDCRAGLDAKLGGGGGGRGGVRGAWLVTRRYNYNVHCCCPPSSKAHELTIVTNIPLS